MLFDKQMEIIGVHAEGEVGRVIFNGGPDIPGSSMSEKMDYINTVNDELLRFALYEPRGAAQMTINLLTSPISPGAQMGFIPIQADGAHAMSGSNAMCVATALLETNVLEMTEPQTIVRLDTPAGLINATAYCKNRKVERVEVDMPQSFVEHLNHPIDVPGVGKMEVDVAFGGCYFVLIDAAKLGFSIQPHEARDLVEMGAKIKDAANAQITVQHPEIESCNVIEYPMFVGRKGPDIVNATIIFPGRLDRSPCGTGTAARLAVMHARGEVQTGDVINVRSIVGSEFRAEVTSIGSWGTRSFINPKISGRSWIFSKQTIGIHPTDIFPLGYTLSDTWGTGKPR
ncbi:proline racemase family protein [Roseibium algae]|uniref:Proline racemase family protein n=1 Tax=Roseibium algae TaxID=3123038 RepID=A0ABU8TEF2_9HYPH